MRIAILGGNSQIALDFLDQVWMNSDNEFFLYLRDSAKLIASPRLNTFRGNKHIQLCEYSNFNKDKKFDVILNFVGAGDPARVLSDGYSIVEVTNFYDSLVIDYLKNNNNCKYVFMSSGAVYGDDFDAPATFSKSASINLNNFSPSSYYGLAKLCAEARHRSMSSLSIVDLRIYSYFSYSHSASAKYLMSEVMASLLSNNVFVTSADNIIRDYIGPLDFSNLINLIIKAPAINAPIDCYSRSPINKISLLDLLKKNFNLRYEVCPQVENLKSPSRINYYTLNHSAQQLLGYEPQQTSAEVIIDNLKKFMDKALLHE